MERQYNKYMRVSRNKRANCYENLIYNTQHEHHTTFLIEKPLGHYFSCSNVVGTVFFLQKICWDSFFHI